LVHEEDYARIVEFIIEMKNYPDQLILFHQNGSKQDLMKAIRKSFTDPLLPMPNGCWIRPIIIRTETELIIKSRNVIPKRLVDAGFEFKYGDLDSALKRN